MTTEPTPPITEQSPLVYLHTPTAGEFFPVLTLGREDLPKTVGGQPATYLWKDLIHEGKYIHPTKGFEVDASREKLDTWLRNFGLMKSRGVEVSINVDHSEKAKDSRGWLIEAKREGTGITGLCQFIGEAAATEAACNRVSVGIDEDFKDGKGNAYGSAIRHVALTPMPVVPNQNPFVIAASAAAAGGEVLLLAAVNQPNTKEPPMADKMLKCSEDTLSTLQGQVPGFSEKTDEDKLGHLAQHVQTLHSHVKDLTRAMGREYGLSATDLSGAVERVKTLSAQATKLEGLEQSPDEAQLNLSRIATERDTLTQERDRLSARVTELSAKEVKALDPESEAALMDAVDVKLSNAIHRGGINPATKDRLKALLVKDAKGKVNTLALSRAANPIGNTALALAIADVLIDNRPVPLGEQSGLQTLSRVAPGEPTDEEKAAKADEAKAMMNKYLAPAKA